MSQTMKTCIGCGAQFGCGAASEHVPCWCAELPHIMELNPTSGCYCPTCLTQKIDDRLRQGRTQSPSSESTSPGQTL